VFRRSLTHGGVAASIPAAAARGATLAAGREDDLPEGPEIRRAADSLARAVAGRRVRAVAFASPRLRRHEAAMRGRRLLRVESRGKALLLHFSGGLSVYTHNQLYGRWAVVAPGARPASTRELRLAIDTAVASALLYSASDIEVLATGDVAAHPYIRRLGVELLGDGTTLADVRRQVIAPRFAGRGLGSLLLDQGFLAGVGNYLRSEILFEARLHPQARPGDLEQAALARLARAALSVTRRSWRTGGITNEAARVRAMRRAGLPFARYRHHVFDREGEPCYACGATIRRESSAGRGLYRCPDCQPRPRPRARRPRP